MRKETEETKSDAAILPVVTTGIALVVVGIALAATQPWIGFTILVVATTILIFAVARAARLQKAAPGTAGPKAGLALLALVFGMMLSGGGAAWSSLQDPLTGLAVALTGAVLCGLGGWWLIVHRP